MTNNVGKQRVTGAEAFYDDAYKKFFAAAYPGDALAKLFVQGNRAAVVHCGPAQMVDQCLQHRGYARLSCGRRAFAGSAVRRRRFVGDSGEHRHHDHGAGECVDRPG